MLQGYSKDSNYSSSEPSTLELGEEMKQVLASYDMCHSDIGNMWETATARSPKS
jgi:hypothetical protein